MNEIANGFVHPSVFFPLTVIETAVRMMPKDYRIPVLTAAFFIPALIHIAMEQRRVSRMALIGMGTGMQFAQHLIREINAMIQEGCPATLFTGRFIETYYFCKSYLASKKAQEEKGV